jgi:hypothetical protein
MIRDEFAVVKKYIDEYLAKGFIRLSSLPCFSLTILVRKPGGGFRFCVDYRALNAFTIKNRYPILLIRETLDRLYKTKYYIKLDIIAVFNKIRIREGDEYLTSFNIRYGQFEYLIMLFGLCNAPSIFQSYINNAFRNYLDVFCSAYLDDIFIFSNTLEEYRTYVTLILERLVEAGLYVDIDKSEFEITEIKYLGLIVIIEGIRMDSAKIEIVFNWSTPRTVKDV